MLLLTPNWAAGHLPGKRKRLTVGDVLEDWFTNVATRTSKESTLKTNRGYLDKRIKPVLGSILVERLAVHDLDNAYQGWPTDPISSVGIPPSLSAINPLIRRDTTPPISTTHSIPAPTAGPSPRSTQ